MLHLGTHTSSGNISPDLKVKIDQLLTVFTSSVAKLAIEKKLRLGVARARLKCHVFAILDDKHLAIIATTTHSMPSITYYDEPYKSFSLDDLHSAAKHDFNLNDYFIIRFPRGSLSLSPIEQNQIIEVIAKNYVNDEIKRANYMVNIVQFNPIFGDASFKLDEKLVFVLMPFNEKRSQIYNEVIKPLIESEKLGLVCRRADELRSNTAVMRDIWKSICEARIIIADLSELNANVMYELGIAHTVGKETILLYEKNDQAPFPFDLSHIRRIEYSNELTGTKKLERTLEETIKSVIEKGSVVS